MGDLATGYWLQWWGRGSGGRDSLPFILPTTHQNRTHFIHQLKQVPVISMTLIVDFVKLDFEK